MPRIPHSRDIKNMAAKELAKMLYEDEMKARKRSEDLQKRKELQRALTNLNTYGWVECPYPEFKEQGLIQVDPSKAEIKVINGSLFWIGECPNGKKVYVNIFLKKFVEPDLSVVWMPDVIYMSEEEFQHWKQGNAFREEKKIENIENINPRDVNVKE